MNFNKERTWLKEACMCVKDFYGEDYSNRIYLLSVIQGMDFRKQMIKELEAIEEPYISVSGETIIGDKGFAILLYPEVIDKEYKITDTELWFKHIVYHECTHAYFAQINREISLKQMHVEYRKRMQSGYTILDEFVAETNANHIENAEPQQDFEKVRESLVRCLMPALPYMNGGKLNFASLGHYSAMMLTDPTIIELLQLNPRFERGFKYCSTRA